MDEHGRIDEQRLTSAHPFDIAGCRKRLAAAGGGYEVVHRSAGLELGSTSWSRPSPTASSRT